MNNTRRPAAAPSYVPLRRRGMRRPPALPSALLLAAVVAFALALSALLVLHPTGRGHGRSPSADLTPAVPQLGETGTSLAPMELTGPVGAKADRPRPPKATD